MARPKKDAAKPTQREVDELKAELKQSKAETRKLNAELTALKTSKQAGKAKRGFSWRGFFKWTALSLAAAMLLVGNLFFWVGRTLTETDRYMASVGPLIEQPAIQKAVATEATNKLFETVDVEQFAADALPPRAAFLAPTLETQLKNYTQKTAETILANPKFQTVWIDANERAHDRLITFVKNYKGDGTIDLNDVYRQLSGRLASSKLSFLANKQLPASVGSITIANASWLPYAHAVVTYLPPVRIATIALFFIFIGAALWLSRDKRKTLIQAGFLLAAMMVVTIVGMRIARITITNNVDPTYQEAVGQAWYVFFKPLFIQSATILFIALFVVIVAWLTGQYRTATALRTRLQDLFAGKLHEGLFGSRENGLTRWLAPHKRPVEWAIFLILIMSLVFTNFTVKGLVVTSLIAVVLILIVELVAGKKPQISRKTTTETNT